MSGNSDSPKDLLIGRILRLEGNLKDAQNDNEELIKLHKIRNGLLNKLSDFLPEKSYLEKLSDYIPDDVDELCDFVEFAENVLTVKRILNEAGKLDE